ncbi:TPA: hypothetical protein ACH3X2_013949 [Trebouxia sp. C0005]
MSLRQHKGLVLIAVSCLCVVHLCANASAALSSEFQADLQKAETAQEERREPLQGLESNIIALSPKALLANGDGDISTIGDCAGDIDTFCATITAGRRRLADCLQSQVAAQETGNVQGKAVKEDCLIELAAFQADLTTNVNKDIPLALACELDAASLCNDMADDTSEAAISSCLWSQREQLSANCSAEVLNKQQLAAKDYRIDPYLHDACQADAESCCKGTKAEKGQVQACLLRQQGRLTWECQNELFRQEVEGADDIRLNAPLVSKCMSDKRTFCNDVAPGSARVKDCLEQHRQDDGFSSECRDELENVMQERATDFRLDSSLRDACEEDIMYTCGWDDELDESEGQIVSCLQDSRDMLMNMQCQEQVHKVMARASEDIRFNQMLADACFNDREQFCSTTQQGSARVIRCLQDARSSLSKECQASLFDQEVKMAEDIDFKFPLKRACTFEIQTYCADVEHGHANVIRCLQNNTEALDMSTECKEAIQGDQARSSQDYRLNFKLAEACKRDTDSLCPNMCQAHQACGGQVLRCLTEKNDQIEAKKRRDEVFYFKKMEVTDFRNDVLLAEACRDDVDELCSKVKPGAVLQCLRSHRTSLSSECRKEELKLGIIQSQDIRLQPTLHKQCSEEIAVFCPNVEPGQARVFGCLQENIAKSGFGDQCKQQVQDREARMQEDYRLDYGVASQCEADVNHYCSVEKGKAHGETQVIACLVSNYQSIVSDCQREVSRAVRMALWEYQPQLALTKDCDEDVQQYCQQALTAPRAGVWGIGTAGRCLSKSLAEGQYMAQGCKNLVIAAAPKDVQALFVSDMSSSAMADKFMALQNAAGIKTPLVNPRGSGIKAITLTGWGALAALTALTTVTVGGSYFGYRRYISPDTSYVMVSKSGDV